MILWSTQNKITQCLGRSQIQHLCRAEWQNWSVVSPMAVYVAALSAKVNVHKMTKYISTSRDSQVTKVNEHNVESHKLQKFQGCIPLSRSFKVLHIPISFFIVWLFTYYTINQKFMFLEAPYFVTFICFLILFYDLEHVMI